MKNHRSRDVHYLTSNNVIRAPQSFPYRIGKEKKTLIIILDRKENVFTRGNKKKENGVKFNVRNLNAVIFP